jgi:CubicO group peptidase (beta-lactamase class C family)
MMIRLRFIFITLLLADLAAAQSWQDTLTRIDKAFSQYHPENPGCQVSVSRNGQVIFSKAWGMADLERNVPLTTHSILEGGSVSKQFTAAAILLLEQQGKLSLDDDVRKYIPELRDYGTPILLRHMLHHTSGLRDWGEIAGLAGWPRGKKFYTNDDALEIIARQQHLNNIPGAEYIYSNSNYNLFAIIVQRVSGMTLAAFTHKYIFEPAGMEHTSWRDNPNRIVPNRAIAYAKSSVAYQTDMPNEYVYGNGGLLTTTEDLLKWNAFYEEGKLGNPSLFTRQTQIEPLGTGAMNIYAAGLFINTVMGWYNISHSGATAGYRAYLETFPDLHLSIALLSNTAEFNISGTAATIRKIFVTGKTNIEASVLKNIALTAAQLNTLAGLYKNEREGSTFQLSVKDGHMVLDDGLALKATGDNTLAASNFLFRFNGTGGWYIPFLPRDSIPFTKMEPFRPEAKDLEAYSGKYFSDETGSIVTIDSKDDKLFIHLKPGEGFALMPAYKNAFRLDALDAAIEFTPASGNTVATMIINVPRARHVVFKKM